jgi:amino acid transporter
VSAKPRTRRYGWRRPVWRDLAWWYAVLCTALVGGLVTFLFTRNHPGPLVWIGIAFMVLLLWVIFSALIRIYVGVLRAAAEGKAEGEAAAAARLAARADAKADAAAAEGDRMDEFARSTGRFFGRAVSAGRKARDTYREQP